MSRRIDGPARADRDALQGLEWLWEVLLRIGLIHHDESVKLCQ